MSIKVLDEKTARYYCAKEEDQFFDRKSKEISGAKIQKIAVAFANSDGGEFVVGIDDEKTNSNPDLRWNGHEKTEMYNGIIQALSELVPSIDFRFDYIRREGEALNYVLRVVVNKGLKVHETAAQEVYVRTGAQSLKITDRIKLIELSNAKGISSEEDSLVDACSIDDIEGSDDLKIFINELPLENSDHLRFLLQENLIHPVSWVPRVAAVLLFCNNPSAVLPRQCGVRIVRYDTRNDDIDRDALIENIIVEGSLYKQIKIAFDIIKEEVSKNSSWSLDGIKKDNYPDEAIWEVLVNSVIHRDYSISDNVVITIFRNRVEFKSPGRFPGYVTVDNILDNRFSRNSKLVRLLSKYKSSPNRDLGEGMNTAFQKMRTAGLKDPEIFEDGNYVKVIFRHAPKDDDEKVIMAFIHKYGKINNRQALDILGLEKSEEITNIFSKMRIKKIIKRVEETSGPASIWVLHS